MAREMRPNDAYAQFASNFEESIGSAIFLEPKVKVFPLQTGGGKSYYQDKEMPLELKEAFPEMKYIFRLSPTREVAYDGTFVDVSDLSGKYNFGYVPDPPSTGILDAFGKMPNTVLCISCTHTYFITNFDRLIKYAPDSVLIIEEAHQFIGCADTGSESYIINFGYSAEYTAETWQRIATWRDVNPRILGFTATPTEHHKGHSSLSDQFRVCGKLADKKVILPSQAWINRAHPYSFTKYQGQSSVESAIHQSIDLLFEREQKLTDLKYYSIKFDDDTYEKFQHIKKEESIETDEEYLKHVIHEAYKSEFGDKLPEVSNFRSDKDDQINTKLTALYVCGDTRGVWGCSIDEVRETICKYLLADCGYEESDKMIATMVESSSGGNTIWTLGGVAAEKVDNPTLMQKLHAEHDPLRFLLVINRGRSGINVHNLTAGVICRIRDPKEVRTPIPIQIFGRMVRLNPGTGDIVRKKYMNSLDNYLMHYPEDYGVDINTVLETIMVSNVFDIWHPTNGKAKRTWEESLFEFQKDYVNSAEEGYEYLYEFTGIEKPLMNDINLEIEVECPCDGSKFMVNVNKEVEDWKGNGTLDAFFNLV